MYKRTGKEFIDQFMNIQGIDYQNNVQGVLKKSAILCLNINSKEQKRSNWQVI